MARRRFAAVLAGGLIWTSIQACRGESIDESESDGDMTGGTAGRGGGSTGGSSGSGGDTGGSAGNTGGSAGSHSGGSAGDAGGSTGGDTGGAGGTAGMGGAAGTGTGGDCQNATIGTLCVVGPDDGMLDVGDPLTIMIGAYGCYSSSCTHTVISECSVGGTGGEYVVTAQICLRVDSSGACTDDCGGAGSPRCQANTPLSEGTHRVRYSNLTVEFEVPSALSGARCASFL